MKKLLILFLSITCIFLSAQNKNNIDKQLVGEWKGFEKNQQIDGMQKYWMQQRTADGTFVILFIAIAHDGEVIQFSEKGKWWTEGNLFHELHYSSGLTDVYTYEFLNDKRVKFKAKKMSFDLADPNYEFIDERIDEN